MEQSVTCRKLKFPEIKLYDEAFLRHYPKLRRVVNVHITFTSGIHIINHIPIEGLVLHCDLEPELIDAFINKLSVIWVQKIKYLRVYGKNGLHCTIYKDKILNKYSSKTYFKKINITAHKQEYYNKISYSNNLYSYTLAPKVIIDLDEQLRLEGSKIQSLTLIQVPLDFDMPSYGSFGMRYRIVTPLWLTYFLISQDNIQTDKKQEIIYRMKSNSSRYTYTNYFPELHYGMRLQDILERIIQLFAKQIATDQIEWLDDIYLSLLEVETIHFGKQIRCHP